MLAAALWAGGFALAADEGHGPPSPDKELERAISFLEGSFQGDGHTLHIGRVSLPNRGPTVYVELTRTHDELTPLRQQFWVFDRRADDQMFVRIYEPPGVQNRMGVLIGAWAAPEYMVRPDYRELDLFGDVVVRAEDDAFVFETEHPIPIDFDGASTVNINVIASSDEIEWGIEGVNSEAEIIWGEEPLLLDRQPERDIRTVRDDGLVIIDLREGTGDVEAAIRDSVAIDWQAYLMNGAMLFDTTMTQAAGRQQFIRELRSDNGMPKGWTEGIVGMKTHGIRRIIIPPHLAYGAQGEGQIPPNSWVIFDLELQSIKDNTPD